MAKYSFRDEISGFYQTFGKGIDKSGKLEKLTDIALQKGKSYSSRHSNLMKEIRKSRFNDKEEEYVENLMHTLEGYISNQKKAALAYPDVSRQVISDPVNARGSLMDRIREFSSNVTDAFRNYNIFGGIGRYATAYVAAGLFALTACGLHSNKIERKQVASASPQQIVETQKSSPNPKKELDSYEQQKLNDTKRLGAKKGALAKCYDIYLSDKERKLNNLGIPYVGSDKVTDKKPGEKLSIPVEPVSAGKPNQFNPKIPETSKSSDFWIIGGRQQPLGSTVRSRGYGIVDLSRPNGSQIVYGSSGSAISKPAAPSTPSVVKALPAGDDNVNKYRIQVQAPGFLDQKPNKLPNRTFLPPSKTIPKAAYTPVKGTQKGPLGKYADYSSDEKGKIGSTNPKINMDFAEERFTNAGKKVGDAFTGCSFAKDKPPIGYDYAAKSSLNHLKNWGDSIVDPLKPNSPNYKGHSVPERALNFLGAIPAGAFRLPTDILASLTGNTSRRAVDRFIEAGDDAVGGLVNTFSSPGNLVPNDNFRRANTGVWRFGGNVIEGEGFANTLDPQKRMKKGPVGYGETFLNIGGAATSFARIGNSANNSKGYSSFAPSPIPAPIPIAPRVVRPGRVAGSGGN